MFDVKTIPSIVVVLDNKVLVKIDDFDILMNTDKLTNIIREVYKQ